MRIDIPLRRLFVEHTGQMGALLHPQDIHIFQADILNGSIVLSAKEDAGFRPEVNVVHDHAADFSGNPVASAPFGGR